MLGGACFFRWKVVDAKASQGQDLDHIYTHAISYIDGTFYPFLPPYSQSYVHQLRSLALTLLRGTSLASHITTIFIGGGRGGAIATKEAAGAEVVVHNTLEIATVMFGFSVGNLCVSTLDKDSNE